MTGPAGLNGTTDRSGPRASADEHPIRVAQIVTTLTRGGAQATVLAATDQDPGEVEVTVLAGPPKPGADTFWADRDADRVFAVPHLTRPVDPVNDLRALWWLIRWLRSNRPDVVHTHSAKAGVLGRLAAAVTGIPAAHTVHGWGPMHSDRRLVRAVALMIERAMAKLSRALVVVGTADLDLGLAAGVGRPAHYHLIRSGVDVELGRRSADHRQQIRAELLSELSELGLGGDDNGDDQTKIVGMVARMAEPKDHRTLIAAFAKADLPGSVLVLIGDGPRRPSVEAAVAEHGIDGRVLLAGARPDAARLVAAFDVAVLASRWEGMPRVVVEAAAASVPMITTDVGSVTDLIEDDVSGTVVAVGDVDALAGALSTRFARPERSLAMAAEAQRRVDGFSVEVMCRDLVVLWRALASRSADGLDRSDRDERPVPKAVAAAPAAKGPDRNRRRPGRRRALSR